MNARLGALVAHVRAADPGGELPPLTDAWLMDLVGLLEDEHKALPKSQEQQDEEDIRSLIPD